MNLDTRRNHKGPEVSEVREAEVSVEVRPLIENVYRQIEEITDRYGVADTAAFVEMLNAAPRHTLFAAEKDVVRLSQLVERLEYLWKEHKEVERAFAMRKQAVEIMRVERAHVGRAFAPEHAVQCQFFEAAAYCGTFPRSGVAEYASLLTSNWKRGEGDEVSSLLRTLGRFGYADVLETLVQKSPKYEVHLRAMYAAGDSTADKAGIFDTLRDSVDLEKGPEAYAQIFVIAAAERYAGLDNRFTLSLVEERSASLTQSERDGLGLEYAMSGRADEGRRMSTGSVKANRIRFAAATYAATHGDLVPAEEIAKGSVGSWGSKAKDLLLPYWVSTGAWENVNRYFIDPSEVIRALAAEDRALADAYYNHEHQVFELRTPESLYAAMAIVWARNGVRELPVHHCKALLDDIERWRGGDIEPLQTNDWFKHKAIPSLCDYIIAMDVLGEDTAEIMRAIKDVAEGGDSVQLNMLQSIEHVAVMGDTVGAIRLMRYHFDGGYIQDNKLDQINRIISVGAAKEALRLAKKSYEVLQRVEV